MYTLKSRVLTSYSPPVLLVVSPIGFQSQIRGLIYLVLDPMAGVPNVELEPLTS